MRYCKKSPTINVFSTHLNTTHSHGNMESILELISYATEKKIMKPWKNISSHKRTVNTENRQEGNFAVWKQATFCKLLTNVHKPDQMYALRYLTFKWRWW